MKSGQCPKCGSSEVYHKLYGLGGRGGIVQLKVFGAEIEIDAYVCTGCGYVESYAVSEGGFPKIEEQWSRVA